MAVEGVGEVSDWSTADIPSQQGRVAVVTGTNSGLGFVTARELARAGATVLMTSRDPARGADAEQRLRAAVPGADVRLESLDLASLGTAARRRCSASAPDRKSTRLNSSHPSISYAVFCLKK